MIRIGFSFNRAKGGPANFMNNLKESWEKQGIVKTSMYFNPLNDCNIFANLPKLTWLNKFFFRIDGIIYDIMADPKLKQIENNNILRGAKEAQGVIFQSEFSKKIFETILGFVPYCQTIIHNGTNIDRFRRGDGSIIKNRLGLPMDSFVFITSAKWRTHKRLIDIVDSFIRFKERHPKVNTYLLVIGEHKDLKIQNVIFLQRINNYELPLYYSAANVYLFYSWLDPCPNSVVEAISCGLPTICTNQGGTPELIKMSNGGIVAEADEPFLYKEVELYNPPHPDMTVIDNAIEEMYANYDYYCERIDRSVFDIDLVAKKYYEFINTNL